MFRIAKGQTDTQRRPASGNIPIGLSGKVISPVPVTGVSNRMTQSKPEISRRYDLFPTPVMTWEHETPDLNAALKQALVDDPFYRSADQAQKSDSINLCDLAGTVPAFRQLETLALADLTEYCRQIGWIGEFDVEMQMFANVSAARHYVPSHNHVAHIASVYYVATTPTDKPVLEAQSAMKNYWQPAEGALILHDPRFNASLMGGWQFHAHVHPRPGLMIMFPAFVWHEVVPHFQSEPRLSIAVNFTLTYRNIDQAQKLTRLTVDPA